MMEEKEERLLEVETGSGYSEYLFLRDILRRYEPDSGRFPFMEGIGYVIRIGGKNYKLGEISKRVRELECELLEKYRVREHTVTVYD